MQLEELYLVITALVLSIFSILYLFYRVFRVRSRLQIDESITLTPLQSIGYEPDYKEKALRKLESAEIPPDQIQRDYISAKLKHDIKEEFKNNVNKYVKEYNENNLDLKKFLGTCLLLIVLVWGLNVYALICAIQHLINISNASF